MLGKRKFFNRGFARVSPFFGALGFVLLGSAGIGFGASARETRATANTAVKREAAGAQFDRAEQLRAILNRQPSEKRTLSEYKEVVASYRRVYLITPRAAEVQDALLAIAELYTEMGDHFGRNYYQSSVEAYRFLLHEYPASKYSQHALLCVAKLQRDQLGETAQAAKTYEEFLKKYPRSKRKLEAQEALAELALLKNGEPAEPTAKDTANAKAEETAAVRGGAVAPGRSDPSQAPRVRRIRAGLNEDATQVIIDLEDSVQYTSARIHNPERIFFDLHAARLTPEVARGNVQVKGNLLTAVRVAQNQAGVVRVVLDVNGVKDYTASLLNDPPQLVIDLYGNARGGSTVRTAKSKQTKTQAGGGDSSESVKGESSDSNEAPSVSAKNTTAVDPGGPAAPSASPAGERAGNGKAAATKSAKAANAKPDLIQPTKTPAPTRNGQETLTRTLGLKIGRIVIDAGHGGHDTGTIGPTGLMEKDLCLDVALRLGKIIEQRLPGADVVYTRADDTFIPLEERTNLANEAKADLFISIHANSSQDHGTRGVETYYLNLKGSPEAMEVAARENASSEQGVHDLEELVKKIARNEKIDESREFAEDIQDSLSKRIQKTSKSMKNRGVRKAPFVVLIGADMPSILTEISFLSNTADEQLLKKPEYRQRLAEGLYQGVVNYLQNLNSVTLNLGGKNTFTRPRAASQVEQSRNQR
jgi:N-acetylmuramoyl-L-alanine amidase